MFTYDAHKTGALNELKAQLYFYEVRLRCVYPHTQQDTS